MLNNRIVPDIVDDGRATLQPDGTYQAPQFVAIRRGHVNARALNDALVNWDDEAWGGGQHESSTGSWVPDSLKEEM